MGHIWGCDAHITFSYYGAIEERGLIPDVASHFLPHNFYLVIDFGLMYVYKG